MPSKTGGQHITGDEYCMHLSIRELNGYWNPIRCYSAKFPKALHFVSMIVGDSIGVVRRELEPPIDLVRS